MKEPGLAVHASWHMPESQAGNSQWEWGLLRRSPKGIKVRSLHLTVNSPNSMRDNTCQYFSRFLFLIMCDCVCLECGFGGPRKQLWATWHGCWRLNSSPLEKQEALLTARLSPQPPSISMAPNGWPSCKQDPPQSFSHSHRAGQRAEQCFLKQWLTR